MEGTSEKIYVVTSTETDLPYLDQGSACYIFSDYNAARECSDRFMNACVKGPVTREKQEFLSECYAIGAHTLIDQSGNKVTMRLDEAFLDKKYYNPDASGIVIWSRQTHQKKYLDKLYDSRVIVPVKIVNKDFGVDISYASVGKSAAVEGFLYILFTNMDEFDFAHTMLEGWSAIEVDFRDLKWMSEGGVVINPKGQMLKIKAEDMRDLFARREVER